MITVQILFWLALFLVFYTHLGYGILLYTLVKLKELTVKPVKRQLPPDKLLPDVTLFITAFNEEDVVDEKMRNCLKLDYPEDKLHIVWTTDGSNDSTNERLKAWPQATVHFQPLRQGKTAAMTRGMTLVDTPLVVFTDANTMLNREAIREIVLAFEDPGVGCVAGEKRIAVQEKDGAAAGGEGIYWKYESTLKALDARLYSAVGAAGELFAIRRELFTVMEPDTLLDDFILSLRIAMQGYKIAYCTRAYAIESGSADMGEEQKRKVRIGRRRTAIYLAAEGTAQSLPLRSAEFPVYITQGAAVVGGPGAAVRLAPAQRCHTADGGLSYLVRHHSGTSGIVLHLSDGRLLPVCPANKKQAVIHPILFPVYEH